MKVESRHPCLVPDFIGDALDFSPFSRLLAISLVQVDVIILGYVQSIPSFLRTSTMKIY